MQIQTHRAADHVQFHRMPAFQLRMQLHQLRREAAVENLIARERITRAFIHKIPFVEFTPPPPKDPISFGLITQTIVPDFRKISVELKTKPSWLRIVALALAHIISMYVAHKIYTAQKITLLSFVGATCILAGTTFLIKQVVHVIFEKLLLEKSQKRTLAEWSISILSAFVLSLPIGCHLKLASSLAKVALAQTSVLFTAIGITTFAFLAKDLKDHLL